MPTRTKKESEETISASKEQRVAAAEERRQEGVAC